jgi:serine/threonine protein kinase
MKKISSHPLLLGILLLWILQCVPIRLRGATVESPPLTPPTTTNLEDTEDAFFVLCTADGTIYSLHAWTGDQPRTLLRTPPLLTTHSMTAVKRPDGNAEEDEVSIVPALDGRLYWKRGAAANAVAEALPMTIQSLLEHPVRSCPDESAAPCGILTATARTSLVALTAGQLQWHTTAGIPGTPMTTTKRGKRSPTLLLQRKDYHIQLVSVASGEPTWNATLGTFQALDFDSPSSGEESEDDDEYEYDIDAWGDPMSPSNNGNDDSDGEESITVATCRDDLEEAPVPAVVFTNHGRTLVAVHPTTKHILWRIDTPATLASVFAMRRGQWQGVQVWSEEMLSHYAVAPRTHHWSSMLSTASRKNKNNMYDNNAADSRFRDEQHRQPWKHRLPTPPDMPTARVTQEDPVSRRLVHRDMAPLYPLLELPAPSPSPTFREEPLNGILISWPVVMTLLMSIIALAIGGRYWYVRKKAFWMNLLQRMNESNVNNNNNSDKSSSASKELDGTLALVPTTTTQVRTPSNSTGASPWQGIPLVQYSRYASEFKEVAALGRGGFGTVFQCQNALDGRDYAIKKVSIRGNSTDQSFQSKLQRVLREVKILAVLDHPNIVRYYTAWLELEDHVSLLPDESEQGTHTMTRCYSSSLLTNDAAALQLGHSAARRHSRAGGYNPYSSSGWNDQSINSNSVASVSEEPSMSYGRSRPHFYNRPKFHDDDFIYFEDSSKENSCIEPDNPMVDPIPEQRQSVIKGVNERKTSSKVEFSDMQKEDESVFTQRDSTIISPPEQHNKPSTSNPVEEVDDTATDLPSTPTGFSVRHTLYIQMQLCSQKTIADFLTDKIARQGHASVGSIDVPKALRTFLQIALAVQHVHAQGLIHRDLKPSNCFMDETGSVKVGDFGLSRESSSDRDEGGLTLIESSRDMLVIGDDHTAGVGTRSYASPEQMSGSDYDSSTDVYSLGIILFELCYPMYTGMERNICLSKLRQQEFPYEWQDNIGHAFPTLQDLIQTMLNLSPSSRPTAVAVANHIQSLMGEFTILSLDNQPDLLLLRVEAADRDDVLPHTLRLLREAGPVEVVQYGLRSSHQVDKPTSILEFALRSSLNGQTLLSHLQQYPEIYLAQVSHLPNGKK